MRARVELFTGVLIVVMVLIAGCGREEGGDSAATATPEGVQSPAREGLVVAWVADGELFVWRGGDDQPQRIDGGDVIRPFLAPNGARVAYLRGPDGDPQSVWISDLSGTRLLIDALTLVPDDPTRRPWQIVWVGEQIYFNTLTGEQISTRTADDLWRVDPASGTVERLLPDGEGGRIFPAPDGARLAVVSAGDYTQPGETPRTPGVVAFVDLVTGERTVTFEFPAVATASQWRWYPALHWLPGGSGVMMSIPDPDLVYGDGSTAQWVLSPNGEPVRMGAVDADFFGLPTFSADGEWMAYIERRESPAQTDIALMIAARDGSAATPYAEGEVGSLGAATWLPAVARFVYADGAPGDLWIGGPGLFPVRFPAAEVPVSEIVWAGGAVFVVSTAGDGAPALKWGTLEDPSALETIGVVSTAPFFDAVDRSE